MFEQGPVSTLRGPTFDLPHQLPSVHEIAHLNSHDALGPAHHGGGVSDAASRTYTRQISPQMPRVDAPILFQNPRSPVEPAQYHGSGYRISHETSTLHTGSENGILSPRSCTSMNAPYSQWTRPSDQSWPGANYSNIMKPERPSEAYHPPSPQHVTPHRVPLAPQTTEKSILQPKPIQPMPIPSGGLGNPYWPSNSSRYLAQSHREYPQPYSPSNWTQTPYQHPLQPWDTNKSPTSGNPASNYAHWHGSPAKNRPRRRGNLPKQLTDILKSWLYDHLKHPYPTEEDKMFLMSQTNLSTSQINNWFINARRRYLPALRESHAKAPTHYRV